MCDELNKKITELEKLTEKKNWDGVDLYSSPISRKTWKNVRLLLFDLLSTIFISPCAMVLYT